MLVYVGNLECYQFFFEFFEIITIKINCMKTKVMSYNEAKVYLKPLGLKNKEEYDAWWNANKPDFLPQFPEEYYGTKIIGAAKPDGINPKERTELIKKVSRLTLSAKEYRLFQKVLEKGFKNWNDNDIDLLRLLYDLHYYPTLCAFGVDLYPYEQTEQIRREIEEKRAIASKRLKEEPYSMWFKDARNYK
jgi:hypothetical protein